jgi:hypothetical protein
MAFTKLENPFLVCCVRFQLLDEKIRHNKIL